MAISVTTRPKMQPLRSALQAALLPVIPLCAGMERDVERAFFGAAAEGGHGWNLGSVVWDLFPDAV